MTKQATKKRSNMTTGEIIDLSINEGRASRYARLKVKSGAFPIPAICFKQEAIEALIMAGNGGRVMVDGFYKFDRTSGTPVRTMVVLSAVALTGEAVEEQIATNKAKAEINAQDDANLPF